MKPNHSDDSQRKITPLLRLLSRKKITKIRRIYENRSFQEAKDYEYLF